MKTIQAGLQENATQLTVVKSPSKNNGIPQYYRERMSDTTIGKFKQRMQTILDALDSEDANAPLRQLLEMNHRECRISGTFDNCFISFTVSTMEGVG